MLMSKYHLKKLETKMIVFVHKLIFRCLYIQKTFIKPFKSADSFSVYNLILIMLGYALCCVIKLDWFDEVWTQSRDEAQ